MPAQLGQLGPNLVKLAFGPLGSGPQLGPGLFQDAGPAVEDLAQFFSLTSGVGSDSFELGGMARSPRLGAAGAAFPGEGIVEPSTQIPRSRSAALRSSASSRAATLVPVRFRLGRHRLGLRLRRLAVRPPRQSGGGAGPRRGHDHEPPRAWAMAWSRAVSA